jgi:hypothetical protein
MLATMIWLILNAVPVEGAATSALRDVSAGVIDNVLGTILVTATIFGAAMRTPSDREY